MINYRKLIATRMLEVKSIFKETMPYSSKKDVNDIVYFVIQQEFSNLSYNPKNHKRPIMPKKLTIQDYLMTRIVKTECSGTFIESCLADDSGESWTKVALFKNDGQDDDDILYDTGYGYYYSGPGRGFAGEPYIERSKHSIIVRWSGGLDI